MVARLLYAWLFFCSAAAFGRSLEYLQHPMFTHHGAAEESFQNPAAAAASDGMTFGMAGMHQSVAWNAILPLPRGTRLAYNLATALPARLQSFALASRGSKPADAEGWAAGLGFRFDVASEVYVFDPGVQFRKRLKGKGELEIATYTFALLGTRESESGGGYYGDDPMRIRPQWVVQAGWISPARSWEVAGSLEPLVGNEGAPGYYRHLDPLRHLEAGFRPVPWCKLAFKMTEWGIREYRFELGRKSGGFENALKFQMAGLRDYAGHAAVRANLQLSLFGNPGTRQP